jgi:hypothetical protein
MTRYSVKDRMTGEIRYTSRLGMARDVHEETETWCREHLGERGAIVETAPAMYMNLVTGAVDDYDGWWYETEDGQTLNAVDRGEVVEVIKDEYGDWEEKNA